MSQHDLQGIAAAVVRRAQRKGYVVPREIQTELAQAGLPGDRWKEVVALARESLHYRQGRYHFLHPVSPRRLDEQSKLEVVARAVRHVIQEHKAHAAEVERRRQERIDYIQPVKVLTEDRRELTLLSRDLSTTGIRLLGTRSLLGQKVRVHLPEADTPGPCDFVVRILWSYALGDDLYENGGTFVELLPREPVPLRVVGAN